MYGIVNKAIEELITEKFGREKWFTIKENSEIEVDYFLSNEAYNDDITFTLIKVAATTLNIPEKQILNDFGEWWILRTGKEKYGALLEAGGTTLKDFLINLPQFHNRIVLMYPKLTPPEFKVSDVSDNSLQIHYISQREGLHEFVRGLLYGLIKLYQTNAVIELIQSKKNGYAHDIFKVTW
ncbi:MAG: heme NO-binding domain-containing protein [Niabella sp.]